MKGICNICGEIGTLTYNISGLARSKGLCEYCLYEYEKNAYDTTSSDEEELDDIADKFFDDED